MGKKEKQIEVKLSPPFSLDISLWVQTSLGNDAIGLWTLRSIQHAHWGRRFGCRYLPLRLIPHVIAHLSACDITMYKPSRSHSTKCATLHFYPSYITSERKWFGLVLRCNQWMTSSTVIVDWSLNCTRNRSFVGSKRACKITADFIHRNLMSFYDIESMLRLMQLPVLLCSNSVHCGWEQWPQKMMLADGVSMQTS